jgi:hypothetical protein
MATIIIKNSGTTGNVPSTLAQGEFAINVVDGRLFYGSGSGGSVKEFTASGSGGGLYGGTANYIPLWSGASSQTISSLYQAATKQIILGATASYHPGYEEAFAVYQGATTSYNLISGHSDVDSYSQLNIKNFNTGSFASSDVVATADNGNETYYYIDMGINSSTYSATSLVGAANDAYLYSTGNDLYIGNTTPGRSVIIFNGGLDAATNAKMYIHDTGVIGINTSDQGDVNAPPALRIIPPNNNTYNMIETEADLNGFVQSVFSNTNASPSASSDIIIHNDLGSTTSSAYYLDLGINSSTYNQQNVGGPNDTYLIGTGEHMHIGNVGHSPGSDASLYLYTGGATDEFTRVYISASGEVGVNTQNPKYQFDVSGAGRFTNGLIVTGSLISTGGFTGSLQGTATTASYLNTLNQNLTFNGNLTLNGTASISYLNVQYESASVIYSSGSNQFGDAPNDTQTLYGSVIIPTGSLTVTGSGNFNSTVNVSGNLNAPTIYTSVLYGYGANNTTLYLNGTTDYQFGLHNANMPFRFLVTGGSEIMRISGSGQIGIGTTRPTAQLHVSASTTDAAYSFLVQNSSGETLIGAQNNRSLYLNATNATNGSTYIGTTNGIISFNQGYNNTLTGNAFQFYSGGAASTIQGFYTNPGIAIGYSGTATNPNPGTALAIRGTTVTSGSGVLFVTGSSTTKLLGVASETNANILVVSGSGNIGIGTSTPTMTAGFAGTHIKSATNFGSELRLDTTDADRNASLTFSTANTNKWQLFLDSTNGSLKVRDMVSPVTTPLTIADGGNVGIGTPTPASMLDISGSLNISGSGLDIPFQITSGSTQLFFVSSSGTTYLTKFANQLQVQAINDNVSTFGGIGVYRTGGSNQSITMGMNNAFQPAITSNGILHLIAGNSIIDFTTNSVERMRITATGNIGIGTTTPSASLHVSGSTLIGNITAPALNDTTKVTANSGVTTIYAIPTASYDGAFFDYVIRSGSNARAGQIMSLWSGADAKLTETTTTDFGDTSGFVFGVNVSGPNLILSSSAASNSWTVKAIVRSI